jgi:cytosine/adenosine deaminase-related metal-dependent hydrolase
VPVAIHLAETRDELQLLERQDGPFVAFLLEVGVWDPSGLARGISDVMEIFAGRETLWVHGNYLNAETTGAPCGTLVVCPRTHAAFGHTRHPLPTMLARGWNIALGTASLASNPGLDMLGEIRHLRREYPEVSADLCLQWATLGGARALGWDAETGSLTPGKSADLVVVPLAEGDGDPLEKLLESGGQVESVLCRGEWLAFRET